MKLDKKSTVQLENLGKLLLLFRSEKKNVKLE